LNFSLHSILQYKSNYFWLSFSAIFISNFFSATYKKTFTKIILFLLIWVWFLSEDYSRHTWQKISFYCHTFLTFFSHRFLFTRFPHSITFWPLERRGKKMSNCNNMESNKIKLFVVCLRGHSNITWHSGVGVYNKMAREFFFLFLNSELMFLETKKFCFTAKLGFWNNILFHRSEIKCHNMGGGMERRVRKCQ